MLRECGAVVSEHNKRIAERGKRIPAMAERGAAHWRRIDFLGLFLGCSLCGLAASAFAGALLALAGVPLAVVSAMVLAALALCGFYARAKTRSSRLTPSKPQFPVKPAGGSRR